MHELEHSFACANCQELLPYVVLYRLDVMADARFDLLHSWRRRLARFVGQFPGPSAHALAKLRMRQLRHVVAKVQEPVCLDADALADEPCL